MFIRHTNKHFSNFFSSSNYYIWTPPLHYFYIIFAFIWITLYKDSSTLFRFMFHKPPVFDNWPASSLFIYKKKMLSIRVIWCCQRSEGSHSPIRRIKGWWPHIIVIRRILPISRNMSDPLTSTLRLVFFLNKCEYIIWCLNRTVVPEPSTDCGSSCLFHAPTGRTTSSITTFWASSTNYPLGWWLDWFYNRSSSFIR